MPNYEGSLEFTDGDGATVRRIYYMTKADRAAAVATLQGIAEGADDLILGAITNAYLKEAVSMAGWGVKAANTAAGDKEVQGVFVGRVTGNYRFETSLPTFDVDTYTLPGGAIDLTDSEVYEFAETALVGGGVTDYRYTDVIAIDTAKEKFG